MSSLGKSKRNRKHKTNNVACESRAPTNPSVACLQFRSWRRDNKFTTEEIGRCLGVTQVQVSFYCVGYSRPSLKIAAKIKGLCGINPEDWMVPAPKTVG